MSYAESIASRSDQSSGGRHPLAQLRGPGHQNRVAGGHRLPEMGCRGPGHQNRVAGGHRLPEMGCRGPRPQESECRGPQTAGDGVQGPRPPESGCRGPQAAGDGVQGPRPPESGCRGDPASPPVPPPPPPALAAVWTCPWVVGSRDLLGGGACCTGSGDGVPLEGLRLGTVGRRADEGQTQHRPRGLWGRGEARPLGQPFWS